MSLPCAVSELDKAKVIGSYLLSRCGKSSGNGSSLNDDLHAMVTHYPGTPSATLLIRRRQLNIE